MKLAESGQLGKLKPDWFFTGLFKHRSDLDNTIRQVTMFWDDIAKKHNLFLLPIGSVGLTESGRWHYHAVVLTSKHLSYRQIKPYWKCGFAKANRYQVGGGAIPYLLNSKEHAYLPIKKLFAPRRWRNKGNKLPEWLDQENWNIVLAASK
tara:strand:+ start:1494 stop:1943 length:450 start_codon:yes stop_codon:yes gene_type:complete